MIKCSGCGFVMPSDSSVCPLCGKTMKKGMPFLLKIALICVAAVVLFPALMTGGLLTGEGRLRILAVIAIAVLLFGRRRR